MKTMRIQRVLATLPAIVLMSVLPLAAQQKENAPGGDKDKAVKTGTIQVTDQFDWGNVAPAKLQAEIEIKNVGKGVLNISRIQPSCGCTVPEALSDSSLNPGQTVMLHLSLDAAHRTGALSKSVAIYSDDPINQTKIIRLSANVQRDITFNPDAQWLLFNNAVVGKEAQASIELQNSSTKPVTIYPPEITEGGTGVRFSLTKEQVLQPGEKLELNAFVTPTSTQPISGKAMLKTSSENSPSREFTLTGAVTQQASTTTPDATSSLSGSHDTKNK